MTVDLIALARRVVACKSWRWMLGMQAVTQNGLCGHRITEHTLAIDHDMLPDLTDPATLGCLLALVREAYADQCACVFSIDYGPAGVMWQVRLTAGGRQLTQRHFSTEAEALVFALEAAQ